MRFWHLPLIFAAAGLIATSALADDNEFELPTWSGAYQPQDRDERGLWAMDDESERALAQSDLVIRDTALNEYVRSVLCKTVGDDRCQSVRIYILRVPAFNASMSPNGTMRVYSGLLLRVRSEAELASILGHEFAHFELRHTLRGFEAARRGSDAMAWTALLGAVAASYGGTGPSVYDTQWSILGGLYSFKRDQERDADTLGFAYMANAGYRPSAAPEVWRSVMNESDQTAIDRGRRTKRYDGVAFFASHPTSLERADKLSALANRVSGGEFDGFATHRKAMKDWVPLFLADELAMNDFGGTDYVIDRLGGEEFTADLYYAKGELYRARGNPRDMVSAANFYQNALELDPEAASAWRGLGLALLRSGKAEDGRSALQNYLERVPDAPDAPMLQMLVGEE
ncbi:tetratricopeptide repeat protein [Alteriqipengyuania sp. NZ-12B]|uniref:Tetratricopeptide repeat protein n=1 Tax=Alteriqipengyuania abyssalis TaxID=2860200 RepID=A0ABS7PFW6_9SPHN|nr:M48 family metallopeptidase [Alteriqipengyuania abyssalis]MBY8337919.1 tetratricopeptide repeat protein [Alteriqipengyuania abyssalis]